MKVALIGQKGLPAHSGGVERHVDELATRLVASGQEVLAYCRYGYNLNKNLASSYKGVRLIYLPSISRPHFLDTITHTFLASWHAVFSRADVIHYHGIGPAFWMWIPRMFRPSAKILFTFHCQDYFNQKWGFVGRMVLRLGELIGVSLADQVIVVSKTLQKYVKKIYGLKAIYLPNSVAMPQRQAASMIKKLGLSRGNYILTVSRLVPQKGLHLVIDAYQRLSRGNDTLPKLVIVGGDANVPQYVKKLKALANGNPKIIFLGARSGQILAELYSNAKLFVQASIYEGLSVSLLEAMSYGCSVLVSDIAENKEVLPLVGHTFKNGHTTDLALKLHKIFRQGANTDNSGRHNKQHILKNYNADTVFNQALVLYQRHQLN